MHHITASHLTLLLILLEFGFLPVLLWRSVLHFFSFGGFLMHLFFLEIPASCSLAFGSMSQFMTESLHSEKVASGCPICFSFYFVTFLHNRLWRIQNSSHNRASLLSDFVDFFFKSLALILFLLQMWHNTLKKQQTRINSRLMRPSGYWNTEGSLPLHRNLLLAQL